MEWFNFALDILLLLLAFYAVGLVKDFSGMLGVGFGVLALGLVILGLAHLAETVLFALAPYIETQTQELIHRLLVLSGFICLIIGFRKLLVK